LVIEIGLPLWFPKRSGRLAACPNRSSLISSNEQIFALRANEEGSGRQVAIKKSRVSRTVKRELLGQSIAEQKTVLVWW